MEVLHSVELFYPGNEENPIFGKHCAVIGDILPEIKVGELRTYIESKFGELQHLWVEELVGKEHRQALAFFFTQESLEKAVLIKEQFFKVSLISIEQCSKELRLFDERRFILISENDIYEKKKNAQNLLEQGIIQEIGDLLKRINKQSEEYKQRLGNWPLISINDLLLAKFACNILYHIILIIPSVVQLADKHQIQQEIVKFIQSIPKHLINRKITQPLVVITQSAQYNKEIKADLHNSEAIITISQLLEHTSIDIIGDGIQIIRNILYSKWKREDRQKFHPLHDELKNDGILYFVNHNCLQSDDQLRDDAALVLAILLRAQKIEPNLRKAVIEQLKITIVHNRSTRDIIHALGALCGLASNESLHYY